MRSFTRKRREVYNEEPLCNQGSVEISAQGKSAGRSSKNDAPATDFHLFWATLRRISRRWKSVDDPHTTPPDDRGDVRTHTHSVCRPEKERDTTKWRATGVWTLRAVKVVAYFTSWLRETFSSCRSCVHARTKSGGALDRLSSYDRGSLRSSLQGEQNPKDGHQWLHSFAAECGRAIC